MKKSVGLAALLGCLTGGCMASTVRIVTDGVFDNGTRVSTGGVIFDSTSSFEQLTAPANAIFNLGVFLGATNGDGDTFTLTLRQAGDTGSPVLVGAWKAHLQHNILQFEPRPLHFWDGRYEYTWILTHHHYDVSAANVAINAELVMIDPGSPTAAGRRSHYAPFSDASAWNPQILLNGCGGSPIGLHYKLPAAAEACLPDVLRRVRGGKTNAHKFTFNDL